MIPETDITHYGLRVQGIKEEWPEFPVTGQGPITTLTISSLPNLTKPIDIAQFATDMNVMNTVRSTNDPAVIDAYEKLLTVMALTKGRDYGAQMAESK